MKSKAAVGMTVAFIGVFALASLGCKGGVKDVDGYMSAMEPARLALQKVRTATTDAQRGSDPPELKRNFSKLVPALKAFETAVGKVEVADAKLLAAHQALVDATNRHLAAMQALEPNITKTPLPASKETIRASAEEFDAALTAWQEGLQ